MTNQVRKTPLDWLFYHSILLLITCLIDLEYGRTSLTPVLASLSFSILIFNHWQDFTQYSPLVGWPNIITSLRLLLIIIAPVHFPLTWLGFIGISLLILDWLDGFLARKLNQCSQFGASFDMEVDAFFCLTFSTFIASQHFHSLWFVLIGGSLRYVYKIVIAIFPHEGFQETPKKYAKWIAGIYFISLVGYFILPQELVRIILLIGNGLVTLSFAISFFEFFRHPRSR